MGCLSDFVVEKSPKPGFFKVSHEKQQNKHRVCCCFFFFFGGGDGRNIQLYDMRSGQIITTSAEVTPNGGRT